MRRGITADAARARELLDRSTALATALSPHIGYARDGGDRQAVGRDRPTDSRDRARAAARCPTRRSTRFCRRSDDVAWPPGRPRRNRQHRRKNQKADARKEDADGEPHSSTLLALLMLAGAPSPASSASSTGNCFRPRTSVSSRDRIATSGSGPSRSWTPSTSPRAASSPIWAPAAAGSRSGSRGVSARTAGLRRGHPAADDRSDQAAACRARILTTRSSIRTRARRPIRSCRSARSTPS